MTLSPDNLPNDVAALKAMLVAESKTAEAQIVELRAERDRLARDHHRLAHEKAVLEGEVDRLAEQNARLDHIVSVLRRAHFGRRSERLSSDQIELALEDVETGFGVADREAETANGLVAREARKARRANRGHLPKHLPREEVVIEPDVTACPCCPSPQVRLPDLRTRRFR
jgi:transposase